MPWPARMAMSKAGLSASPPTNDVAVNSAMPAANTSRRPKRSARRPPSMSSPAIAMPYALITQGSADSLNPRSASMAGSATVAIEKSRIVTNSAAHSSASSNQPSRNVAGWR
jgi:hypothetical protein